MLRPSLLLGLSSVVVAAFVLNCGDDDESMGTKDAGAFDSSRPDTSTSQDGSAADTSTGDAADGGPAARTIFGVDEASMLLRLTSAAPGTVTKTAITGLAGGETVHGIDFRPKDGTLYALGSTGAVYIIATATGVATAVAGDAGITTFPLVLDPTATSYGFDFNPAADRIRVHSNTGKNYRLHPADGQSVNAAGDPDLGTDGGAPVSVVGTAYTNSVNQTPATTKLYGIDPQSDQLLTFAIAPGFADATSVGALGVDIDDVAGFDIFGGTGGGDGGPAVNLPTESYAALRVAGSTGLYKIDLGTGKATLVGPIGHDKALRGIAIQP